MAFATFADSGVIASVSSREWIRISACWSSSSCAIACLYIIVCCFVGDLFLKHPNVLPVSESGLLLLLDLFEEGVNIAESLETPIFLAFWPSQSI